LGLVQWFKRFIPNLADIAKPLYKLLNKHIDFKMDDESKTAFNTLRLSLTKPPIIRFPIFDGSPQFVLQCDASKFAIGAVLMQRTETEKWIIAYASHQFSPAETRYSAIEREFLAIIWSLKHFKHYILERKVLIQSDHKPLSYLKSMSQKNDRLQRQSIILS